MEANTASSYLHFRMISSESRDARTVILPTQ